MSSKHFPSLTDRAAEAAKAKQAALEKFKKNADSNDPEVLARRKAMAESSQARDERRATAEQARKQRIEEEKIERALNAEEARLAAVRAAEEAVRATETERLAHIEREAVRESELKAARDLRYAARKARKK